LKQESCLFSLILQEFAETTIFTIYTITTTREMLLLFKIIKEGKNEKV